MNNDGADNVPSPEFVGSFMNRVWQCLAPLEPKNAYFIQMCQRHLNSLLSTDQPGDYSYAITENLQDTVANTNFFIQFTSAMGPGFSFPTGITLITNIAPHNIFVASPATRNALRKDAKKLFPDPHQTYTIQFRTENGQGTLTVVREATKGSDGADVPAVGGAAPPSGGGGSGADEEMDASFVDLCMQ
jgi:hypothetical protein